MIITSCIIIIIIVLWLFDIFIHEQESRMQCDKSSNVLKKAFLVCFKTEYRYAIISQIFHPPKLSKSEAYA